VARLWGIDGFEQPGIPAHLRDVEALLHEISHAVVERLRIDHAVTERVTRRFEQLNAREPILGLVQEARAFAAEVVALRALGLERDIRLLPQIRWVWRSGWSGRVLPLPTFLSMYRRFRLAESSRKFGARVAVVMRGLARPAR